MKFINKTLLSLIAIVIITSCKQEEIITYPSSDEPLVGQWKVTEMNSLNTVEIYYQGVFQNGQVVNGEGINLEYYFDIEENPNDLITSGSYGMQYSDNIDQYTIQGISIFSSSQWEHVGDSLIFRSGSERKALFIEELNGNTMKLFGEENLYTNTFGYDFYENAKVNYTFIKIK
ncbi:hypothetical protein [Mangrovivirga cuniculi]|uniref:Lipocalin-like domain-containing protein n=1 Tax=Mangrovivirga cuniculi TaxID=2715131 RepID=A0A4D7JEN1_9BACT|nr:hypothetical protein [Mangrovivirga cuniculi]QCK14131.1 hypothetical protein DCC35_04920 [Mangrovivirga cuniculi]